MSSIAKLPRAAASLPHAQPCPQKAANHPCKTALWNYTPDAVLAYLPTTTARPQRCGSMTGAAQ